MNVKLESLSGLERRLTVSIPAEQIDQEVEKRLKNIAKNATKKGFRPGKVPFNIIKSDHNDAVRMEVLGEQIRHSYVDALKSEQLNPASEPKVDLVKNVVGEPVEYTAMFEVYPHFALQQLQKAAFDKVSVDITEADIQDTVQTLRKQHAEWVDTNKPSRVGDVVVMDYDGTFEGESFEGGSAKGVRIELGSNVMIPGFEEKLVGVKAGEEKSFKIRYPENFHNKKFANQFVDFKVNVLQVLEPKLPEVDEAFLSKFKIEGGIDAFHKQIREAMERDINQMLADRLKQQVIDAFLSANQIEVPKSLVKEEMHRLQHQMAEQMGHDKKHAHDIPLEQFAETAERRVRLGLLFAEFIKANELKPDQERVQKMIQNFAASYQKPEQVVAWYNANKQQLAMIESLVLEEQVIDKLLAQVDVKDKKMTYGEFKESMKQTA